MIKVKPIPNELLGDDIVLITPTGSGTFSRTIYNVRVEKTEEITDFVSRVTRDNTEITVWYDFENSYPSAEFPVAARVKFEGDVYEILESRVFKTDSPHHIRFKARKISEAEDFD